jgi:hypothetical protein
MADANAAGAAFMVCLLSVFACPFYGVTPRSRVLKSWRATRDKTANTCIIDIAM